YKGFEITSCSQAKIWHKVSSSVVGRPHSTYFWWRGRLLWISRHYSRYWKIIIYIRIIIPSICKLFKLYWIKNLQLYFLFRFQPQKDRTRYIQKQRNRKAALTGISDYFFKRFGKGPNWIYKP